MVFDVYGQGELAKRVDVEGELQGGDFVDDMARVDEVGPGAVELGVEDVRGPGASPAEGSAFGGGEACNTASMFSWFIAARAASQSTE